MGIILLGISMILTVVFSNHCDLDCSYCCIGYKNNSPILSKESAIDFILKYKDAKDNVLEFYGGEPTLHWEEIKYIIETLDDLNILDDFYIRIYTNGINIWNDISSDLISYYIDEVLLSLDGSTYDENKQRFASEKEFNTVIDNIKKFDTYLVKDKLVISSVLYGHKKFERMYENYLFFKQYAMGHSYEPVTIWEQDKGVVIPRECFNMFYENMLKIVHDIMSNNTGASLFVAKELMSSSWYNPKDCNKCSSVARAISPRGNVYMCRDHAANEEQMFYSPSVIQFSNNNKLKERDGSFKHILENEGKYTPCVVKDFQYMQAGITDSLYWLEDNFQNNIIKPLFMLIMKVNEKDYTYDDTVKLQMLISSMDLVFEILNEKK